MKFDFCDLDLMVSLMDDYQKYDSTLFGTNENGEHVNIGIYKDRIAVRTYQKNGWTRLNVYYRDGSSEEVFDGRWKNCENEYMA